MLVKNSSSCTPNQCLKWGTVVLEHTALMVRMDLLVIAVLKDSLAMMKVC